jgi:GLPGLI family protein
LEINGILEIISLKKDKKNRMNLENETKEINGFVCYKTEKKVVNRVEFLDLTIAWYCPQIPLSYGPNGYGGLQV